MRYEIFGNIFNYSVLSLLIASSSVHHCDDDYLRVERLHGSPKICEEKMGSKAVAILKRASWKIWGSNPYDRSLNWLWRSVEINNRGSLDLNRTNVLLIFLHWWWEGGVRWGRRFILMLLTDLGGLRFLNPSRCLQKKCLETSICHRLKQKSCIAQRFLFLNNTMIEAIRWIFIGF